MQDVLGFSAFVQWMSIFTFSHWLRQIKIHDLIIIFAEQDDWIYNSKSSLKEK